MTIDEAIASVESSARGRTRYEGQPDFRDEVLLTEIKRLSSAYNAQLRRAMQFKLERDAITRVADRSTDRTTREKTRELAANFEES